MLEKLTLRDAVDFAVRTEQLGRSCYTEMAAKFKDETLRDIFGVLAKDEAVHEAKFRKLLESLPAEPEGEDAEERFGYLRALSFSQFFGGEKGMRRLIGNVKTEGEALLAAAEMEKATINYYHGLRDALGKGDVIQAVIDEEKAHLNKVMRYLLTDAKFRGLVDDF